MINYSINKNSNNSNYDNDSSTDNNSIDNNSTHSIENNSTHSIEDNNNPFNNNNNPFNNNNNQFNNNNNQFNNNNPFNNNNNPFNNNNENPFNNNDNSFNNNFIDEKIEIWIEQFGKKKNTYISGWKLSDKELKEHVRIFKKSHGCNGTLKMNDDNIKVVMFQGDHIDSVLNYLEKLDIDVNNINIKGYDT